jgi:hypothetical protein
MKSSQFRLNIAGLILAFIEKIKDRKKAMIGLIGNSLLLLATLTFIAFALLLREE